MSEHKCQGRIFSDYRTYTCGNKAGHEHEGRWFCKMHHPPTIKEKQAVKTAKWNAEWAAKIALEKKVRKDKAEMERKAAMYDELLSALQAAAIAIHEYRTQGAPHAYWDDIEAQAQAAIEKAMGANNDQG